MSKRLPKLYLEDILSSISKIEDYVKSLSFKTFSDDPKTIDAVVRNLEIIGEAAKNIPEVIRKKYPGTEWKKIAGIRDIIIHAYFELDLDLIWDVVKNKIQDLKQQIQEILKEYEAKNN